MRVDAVKQIDQAHPVMAHTVPLPHFNVITTASNDHKLAQSCDMFDNSLGTDPFATACVATAAKGKVVINSEIHAVGGSAFGRPSVLSLTPEAFHRHLIGPLAHGVRGFQFWQFRAETLGFEAPAWGLLTLDGFQPSFLAYVRDTVGRIRQNME